MLYGIFFLALALGFAAAAFMMHRIFETLLLDWDPVAEMAQYMKDRREARRQRLIPGASRKNDEVDPILVARRTENDKYSRLEDEPRKASPEKELENAGV